MEKHARTRLRRALLFAVSVTAVGLLAGAYVLWELGRVVITVRNSADSPLSDVVLSVSGDEQALGELGQGESRQTVVHPEAASSVQLRFARRGERRFWSGSYVEPAGGYRVLLDVSEDGKVHDQSSLWP